MYDAFLDEKNIQSIYTQLKQDYPDLDSKTFVSLSGAALGYISKESDLAEYVSGKDTQSAVLFLNDVCTRTIKLLIDQNPDLVKKKLLPGSVSDIYATQVHDPSILVDGGRPTAGVLGRSTDNLLVDISRPTASLLVERQTDNLLVDSRTPTNGVLVDPLANDVVHHTVQDVYNVIPRESRNNVMLSKKIPITYVIDSRDRDPTVYPTSDSFTVNTKSTYRDITAIRLLRVVIPNTMYNVPALYNQITFSETPGINITATVPPGNYTTATLPAAIKTAMELAGTSVYTVTIDPVNNTMSINSDLSGGGGIFSLNFFGYNGIRGRNNNVPMYRVNSMAQILGYQPQDFTGGNTYISTGVVNLTLYNNVYVHITQCNKINSTESPDTAFCGVPVNQFGMNSAVTVYTPIQKYTRHFSPSLPKLDRFTVSLKDYNGNPVSLNMADFDILLELIALEDIDVKL